VGKFKAGRQMPGVQYEMRSLELLRELATVAGVASATLPVALGGPLNKAPALPSDIHLSPKEIDNRFRKKAGADKFFH
jgi:hypothetical protein